MSRLVKFLVPFKWWIALAVLFGAATVGSGIGLMATSAFLISAAALHPSIADLGVAIVGVRFFGIARGAFRYLERYVSHQVNFRLLARLRVWFYEAVEPLAPARIMDCKSGDLLTRAVADIETLQDFYVRVIAPPVVAIVIASVMTISFWRFDSTLAITLLIFLTLTGAGMPTLVRRLSRQPNRDLIHTRSKLHSEIVDAIQGIPDVIAFGQQENVKRNIRMLSDSFARSQIHVAWINSTQTAMGNLLMNLAMGCTVIVAITLVGSGKLNGLYLAVIALATLASFEAVLPLPLAASSLESALAAAKRLFAIADSAPAVRDPESKRKIEDQRLEIEIRDLHFAYSPDDPPALNGVTFNLPLGKRLAIVGASGAGKTTLINLLLRFWDYEHGEILLNGVDLRAYTQDDVRNLIGVISQQTYLFNATVRENLLVAKPKASDEEMARAAQRAQIHNFIESLPQKYETWIGERGLRLSGGERQRLAIARALLRHTPILILDEPAANLDAMTAQNFLRSLYDVMQERTMLMITHRLSGLETMDEILVMRQGRIIERGTHGDLLEANGIYRRMWDLQNNTPKV